MNIVPVPAPCKTKIMIGLREADERFIHIHRLIDAKTKMLEEKQKYLRQITNQNAFLKNVLHDYAKYGNYIIQQKRDQQTALRVLNDYINELMVSGKLTKQNIQDAKMEQSKILDELQHIQNYLDDIIDDTKSINSVE
jgi:hypothetical protein